MATHLPPGLSPDAVDALTELTSIVVRLRAAQHQQSPTTSGSAGLGISTTSAPGPHQPPGSTPAPLGVTGTTPLPIPSSAPTSIKPTGLNTTDDSSSNPNLPPLTVKDLPAATDNLRHKIQRARAAMRGLADVQRGIAQQEAEMGGLEARRRAQAARLARTQEDGLQFVRSEGLRDGEGDRNGGEGERMVE